MRSCCDGCGLLCACLGVVVTCGNRGFLTWHVRSDAIGGGTPARRRVDHLKSIGGDGFALAGSGAIREHGILHRATQDIDLFTIVGAVGQFATAVANTIESLTQHGYLPVLSRSAGQSARLAVTSSDGYIFEVDLGVDWGAHDPVHLSIGPVLALEDAVANKVWALYSGAAARDFLDVDAIRTSGRFTDASCYGSPSNTIPGSTSSCSPRNSLKWAVSATPP